MRVSSFETERPFEEIIQDRDPNIVSIPVEQRREIGRISVTYAGEQLPVTEVKPHIPSIVDGTDRILVDV